VGKKERIRRGHPRQVEVRDSRFKERIADFKKKSQWFDGKNLK